MATVTSEDPSIQFIQDVCEVSEDRARELFEAGGSTERAIDIFFSHQAHEQQLNESPPPAKKRKVVSSPKESSGSLRTNLNEARMLRVADSDTSDEPQDSPKAAPIASHHLNVHHLPERKNLQMILDSTIFLWQRVLQK